MPHGKHNPCDKRNFRLFCEMLRFAHPDNRFKVELVWMDHGAGMDWETVICYRPNGASYQVLNGRDWDDLNMAGTMDEVAEIARSVLEVQDHNMREGSRWNIS